MEKGFTLIELLIVVAILAVLATFTAPLGLDFYKDQQLNSSTREVVQSLRKAQLKAMSVELDSTFGIYLTSDNYILFKGDSYFTREQQYDEIFVFPKSIIVSGLSEIIFSKFEGQTLNTGNIILSADNKSQTININRMGMVNLE